MSYKMSWEKLLSSKRERTSNSAEKPYRNCFEMDYQRVIPSSSLRRLQDKTQVFPLQENDFTRTRLTHSLEVSSLGRSIGAQIGYNLKEKGEMTEKQANMLSSLLAVCGLVHDLGNPPFGHYGEDVIKNWFKEKNNENLFDKYTKEILEDFCRFDGNSQTIRILSKLQYMKDCHGMNFCYGTLAALLKYPIGKKDKISHFKSEEKLFNNIIQATGMSQGTNIYRHPATYLLEAADDIAYLFADLEDAVKKDSTIMDDIIKEIEEQQNKIFSQEFSYEKFEKSIKEFELLKCNEMPKEDIISTKIMSIRVSLQGYCIDNICKEFITFYEDIMNGKYSKDSLCNCDRLKNIIGDKGIIRTLCIKHAYQNSEVLSLEIIGKKVLTTLLDSFIPAILDKEYNKPRYECGKFYNLISSSFRFIQHIEKDNNYKENLSEYEKIQLVIDYISGMTDSYALNLHQIIRGMKLP